MALQIYKIASLNLTQNLPFGQISFTSIPQNYKDLIIRYSMKTTRADAAYEGMLIHFNSDTGSNFSWRSLGYDANGVVGSGSASTTDFYTGWVPSSLSGQESAFGITEIYIPNYSSNKTKALFTNNGSNVASFNSVGVYILGGRWNNTSAITSIILRGVNYSSYGLAKDSTATLYGVL